MAKPRLELDPAEVRVLGCMVEKQRTTPAAYPLTLNSLRLACNQATNRDPVLDLDEATVRRAAQRLGERGLARFASGHSGRVAKYRHVLREALELSDGEIALLAVLMLRGPQTPGELRSRAERLHRFAEPDGFDAALERLTGARLAERLERRPGQKEARFRHLLGADGAEEPVANGQAASEPEIADLREPVAADLREPTRATRAEPGKAAIEGRVDRLEAEVDRLREDLDELRRELGS